MTLKPSFFIVGAPKAGTSSLYTWLKQHPQLFLPPDIKEPLYFARQVVPDHDPRAIRSEQAYLKLFAAAGQRIAGEVTPAYLRDPGAPALIKEFCPQARIVITLRHPIERAHSNYLMNVKLGRTSRSFDEEITRELSEATAEPGEGAKNWYYLSDGERRWANLPAGKYATEIKRWLEYFPAEQVHFMLFEHFIKNQTAELGRLLSFLNVDQEFAGDINTKGRVNEFGVARSGWVKSITGNEKFKSALRRVLPFGLREKLSGLLYKKTPKPDISQSARQTLRTHYQADVLATAKLAAKKFPVPLSDYWSDFFFDSELLQTDR